MTESLLALAFGSALLLLLLSVRLPRRRPRPAPPSRPSPEPDPLEVLPCDWTAVANGLRAALGQPPWTGPPRYPTVEELQAWERALPGMAARLRTEARTEARHRQYLARSAQKGSP